MANIPLSGQQRHVLTALHALQQGRGSEGAIDAVMRTYTYLSTFEAAGFVSMAEEAMQLAGRAGGADEAFLAEQFMGAAASASLQHFAEVLIHWQDQNGNTQYRTVRIRYNPGDEMGGINDAIANAVDELLYDGDDADHYAGPVGPGGGPVAIDILALL